MTQSRFADTMFYLRYGSGQLRSHSNLLLQRSRERIAATRDLIEAAKKKAREQSVARPPRE